ncbi:MAG TPA: hypothetical protein VH083_28390, partial [Myxococcales bacterium]|nr:hypothetical protein [Myxococcales bacterium]
MRIAIIAASVLFVACTNPQPPPPDRAAIEAQTQELLKPIPERSPGPMSGFVTARDEKTLSLDSGGQHLVPLKVNARTPTVRDGQPGTAADIREGDVVRAAYSMGPDGAPLATQLVVTSKPFTGRDTPPGTNSDVAAPAPAADQAPAAPAVVDPKTG